MPGFCFPVSELLTADRVCYGTEISVGRGEIKLYLCRCWSVLFGGTRDWGHAVAQLVEALRYKPEGRGFDFR